MKEIKTYSELITIPNFLDRYEYLKIGGIVGEETFGCNRYLNQILYRSKDWKEVRNYVIVRDHGCDLGIYDREIAGDINVHHMNPITVDDILHNRDYVLDPEFLISSMPSTHRAIHYGDTSLLILDPVIRYPGDTCPWR